MTLNHNFRTVRIITRLNSIRVTLRGLNLKVLLFRLRKGRRLTGLANSNIFDNVMLNSQVIVLSHLRRRRILSMLLNRQQAALLKTFSRMNLRRHARRTLRVSTNIDPRSAIFTHRRYLLRNFKGLLRQRSSAILIMRHHSGNKAISHMRHQLLKRADRIRIRIFCLRQQGRHFNNLVNASRAQCGRRTNRRTATSNGRSVNRRRGGRALRDRKLLFKRKPRSG